MWPAIDYEYLDWTPTIPAELLARAQRDRHRGPYRAAVVPLIADKTPAVPAPLATLVSEASAMIARFDAEFGSEIASFATILLRSESASSSQIENLSSGAKQIALAQLGSTEKRNATAIVGNVAAMSAAIALADRLDADTILAMHRALLENHDPAIAGAWRTDQVWIGGSGAGPHGADFVAPAARYVPQLIDDLLIFARRTDLPPLLATAIAHAQFETIHPFPDGNGRTGRALVQSMFRHHGMTHTVTIPVSAGLLADTGHYFATLDAYREGDVVPIIETMANAAMSAIAQATDLVSELRRIRSHWSDIVRVRGGSSAQRLLDVVLRQPVVDTKTVAGELGILPANAARAIAPLVEAGVLVEFTGFRRNRMWQAVEVTAALDDFAARAMRRRLP